MPAEDNPLTRRGFLKATGAAGVGTALAPLGAFTAAQAGDAAKAPESMQVPTRPFGNTGADVSILSLGGVLRSSDQMVFKQAFRWGITYWDTADSYGWGKNEKAIGRYLAKYPDHREKIFLVTKAATSDPDTLTEKLHTSLQRMNTSYVDLYFLHYVDDVKGELTPAVRRWAEAAKNDGKIRFFGFSTHKNMQTCMLDAAKLGWIDGIMMSYNYRLMGTDTMRRAVDACVDAGIGLTAMKTQAAFSANFYASIGSDTDDALKMTERLMAKGYTAEQARLKVVWENSHIASICSAMPTMTILQANVAAALNRRQLSTGDRQRMEQYAQRTAPGYCGGCAHICESAVDANVPICDILRHCMYQHGYGDCKRALRFFSGLPESVKSNLTATDYTAAERRCPQQVPIGKILSGVCVDLS